MDALYFRFLALFHFVWVITVHLITANRFALSILWVFKAWEKALDCVGEPAGSPTQSVAISSGYPLAGCSPAEPVSVSPDML